MQSLCAILLLGVCLGPNESPPYPIENLLYMADVSVNGDAPLSSVTGTFINSNRGHGWVFTPDHTFSATAVGMPIGGSEDLPHCDRAFTFRVYDGLPWDGGQIIVYNPTWHQRLSIPGPDGGAGLAYPHLFDLYQGLGPEAFEPWFTFVEGRDYFISLQGMISGGQNAGGVVSLHMPVTDLADAAGLDSYTLDANGQWHFMDPTVWAHANTPVMWFYEADPDAPVPEPSPWVLAAMGFATLAAIWKNVKK